MEDIIRCIWVISKVVEIVFFFRCHWCLHFFFFLEEADISKLHYGFEMGKGDDDKVSPLLICLI